MLQSVINNGNGYCGPAAISAIAQIGTHEAAARLRSHTGKRSVKGTHDAEVLAVLSDLGYQAICTVEYSGEKRRQPTLAQWLEVYDPSALYLVSAKHHWQVISGSQYVCGQTIEPISLGNPFVPKKARVKRAYKIVPRD